MMNLSLKTALADRLLRDRRFFGRQLCCKSSGHRRDTVDLVDTLDQIRQQHCVNPSRASIEFIRPSMGRPKVEFGREALIRTLQGLLELSCRVTGPTDCITVWAEPLGNDMIYVGIGHSGSGLTPLDQKALLEGSSNEDGSLRDMARAYGGDLWVINDGVFGTTFYLWLPVSPCNLQNYAEHARKAPFFSDARLAG